MLSIQYSAFELWQASGSMVLQQDVPESSEQQVIVSALPDVRIIEGKPYVSSCCVVVYQVVLLVTVHVGDARHLFGHLLRWQCGEMSGMWQTGVRFVMPRRFVVHCSVHVRIGLQVVGRDTVHTFYEGVIDSKNVTWFHVILISVINLTFMGQCIVMIF